MPLDEFVHAIRELEREDFDGILSAHDRFILPKSHIQYMIDTICKIGETERRISLLDLEFIQTVSGNENEVESQDITVLASNMDCIRDSVKKIKEGRELR